MTKISQGEEPSSIGEFRLVREAALPDFVLICAWHLDFAAFLDF